jgi:hypothetical protein
MAMKAIDELSHYFEADPEWECVGRGFNHAWFVATNGK